MYVWFRDRKLLKNNTHLEGRTDMNPLNKMFKRLFSAGHSIITPSAMRFIKEQDPTTGLTVGNDPFWDLRNIT